AGVDGLVVAIDAYFPINHRGVVDYFTSVAKAVELPIVIYTNPNYQKATLSIEVLNELSDLENIVALKDASSNTGRLLSLLNRI
ncbi:dihydrodipicolinate synthase family protein, partial [Streptomyces caeruleatus]